MKSSSRRRQRSSKREADRSTQEYHDQERPTKRVEIGLPQNRLFVNRISPFLGTQRLHDIFVPFGKITDVFIPYEDGTGDHKTFGFVQFQKIESAEEAQIALVCSFVDGRVIQVNFASSDLNHKYLKSSSHTTTTTTNDVELPRKLSRRVDAGQPCSMKRLCISGFSSSLSMQALHEKFLGFGEITDVHIPQNSLRRDQRAFGFVEFQKSTSAEEAQVVMNSSFIDGDRISVQFSHRLSDQERTDSVGSLPSSEDTESRRKRDEFSNYSNRTAKIKNGPDAKETKLPRLSPIKNAESVEVVEKSSADFMNMAAQDGLDTFGEPMKRHIQELRYHIKYEFPTETPAKQTQAIVSLQSDWLKEHLADIKSVRVHFKSEESLISHLDDSTERRQRRALLLSALSRVRLMLEQMFVLNRSFPAVFPPLSIALRSSYIRLKMVMEEVEPCFETTFNSSTNLEKLRKFIHEDIRNIFEVVSKI